MLAPVGGIPTAWPSTMPLGWQSTPTRAIKHRQTTKQQKQQQQQRPRQTSHSNTAVRHTGHHPSKAQPNCYHQTHGWQALKRWLPALTSPVRRCCFDLFLHTKQGAPKRKRVMIFLRLSKSTHRCSTLCPLMNKSSSCRGKHASLVPSSWVFPRILCRKRPQCPVLDVRRYVALGWNSRLASFFQGR